MLTQSPHLTRLPLKKLHSVRLENFSEAFRREGKLFYVVVSEEKIGANDVL